jgi:hypothetical protein
MVLCPGIVLEPLFQVLHPLLDLVQAAFIGQAAAGKKARDTDCCPKAKESAAHVCTPNFAPMNAVPAQAFSGATPNQVLRRSG